MEDKITFKCGELTLSGTVHTPDGGTNLPTIIVLHGFGSNSNSANVKGPVKMLNDWGYGAFRFDMPGCGESDGEFGRVICQEQVEATQAALTYLQSRPEIDGDRIGVLGSSFGAAVAIYAGGVDERFACVVSSGGWGHGERKFRGQHPTKEGWMKFTNMPIRIDLSRFDPQLIIQVNAKHHCRSLLGFLKDLVYPLKQFPDCFNPYTLLGNLSGIRWNI